MWRGGIAHEIKNPLTPIQLSAERLRRKYLKEVRTDPDTFSKCTDTIIRHVEDIGRMVTEFSDFARMPDPVMRQENLLTIVSDTVILQREAHTGIAFELEKDRDVTGWDLRCDGQQVRQVLMNLIQNAIDSITGRLDRDPDGESGRIRIVLSRIHDGQDYVICVTDNGGGLPDGVDPAKLTEPYITHRDKGTGLGLAIVKKVMEDHEGKLVIGTADWVKDLAGWQDLGGATVSLVFPASGRQEGQATHG